MIIGSLSHIPYWRVTITFWEYLRVGLPLTLITLTLGVAWLLWGS